MSFFEPESALASHLEGVRIAGKLDEYILGIKEKGWSRSKKTRDRKAGLSKVLVVMESWEGYAKYEAVQQVMEAVKSSQSSWQDTPDAPTKRAKRGGADTTEGSGGVGGALKDIGAYISEHMLEQLKLDIQDQMKARGVGAGMTTRGVCSKRKSEAREGNANDTEAQVAALRRKTGKAGGRKGGSFSSPAPSNLTVVTCEGHAAKLLASIHTLRSSHPELLDLPTRLILRTGGSSGAEITTAQTAIMAAASPYILSKLTRWRDEQEESGGGGGGCSSSLSSAASSSSSSPSSSADDDTKLVTITIPELGAAALNAAVHFAYTGTVALDPENKDDALPLLAGFQLLDMEDAVETVAEWVGSTLDPTKAPARQVRHTAESLNIAQI
jgi:hypothetical protein